MNFFFFILGNFQKYLPATLLFLLDMMMRFSYLTLGFSAVGFLLTLITKKARPGPGAAALQFFSLVFGTLLFLGSSLIFSLLIPLEVSP